MIGLRFVCDISGSLWFDLCPLLLPFVEKVLKMLFGGVHRLRGRYMSGGLRTSDIAHGSTAVGFLPPSRKELAAALLVHTGQMEAAAPFLEAAEDRSYDFGRSHICAGHRRLGLILVCCGYPAGLRCPALGVPEGISFVVWSETT